MPKKHKRGVDSAIAILEALLAGGAGSSVAELAAGLSIPRSSFYRIVRILETQGIVRLDHGVVRLGDFVASLLARYVDHTSRTERARWRRVGGPTTLVKTESELGRQTLPVMLLPAPSTPTGRRLRIGFANASTGNPWRIALVHSIEAAASSHGAELGRLDIRHAEGSAERQAAQIHALIDAGVDGLIISPVADDLEALPIKRALQVGIQIVILERAGKVPGCCCVSVNDWMMGKTAARWIAETIGGRGDVIVLSGEQEAPQSRLRLAAAKSVFDRHPKINLIAHVWTGWSSEAAHLAMRSAIARWGRRIAAVWSDSGMQAVGSIEAFVSAGFQRGHIPPHTGGDINHFYKLALSHEVSVVGLNNPPALGIYAVEALIDRLRGQWMPARVEVPSEVIVSKGRETSSVPAASSIWVEDHVRWDQPNELIMASGLGRHYNPRSFRVRYPGNRYNRSAARATRRVAS